MIRKSNLLAIVATAALGLAMLSATEASARGHGGGGGGGGCTAAATWAVIWAATWAVAATAADVMSVITIITRTGTLVIAARSGTAG